MDLHSIEHEIEKRRKRAIALGVHELICRIYFEHGFRNYSLVHVASMQPVFPSITDVVERERDRLDFKIDGRQYSIRARERSYNGREGRELEVFRGDQVVFAQILNRANTGLYKSRKVTAFIEGNWLRDFERIDREANDHRAHRHQREVAEAVAERARRFGINPASPTDRPSLWSRILRAISWRSA